MGGIGRALFGGSKSTSSSGNQAYGDIKSGLGGIVGKTGSVFDQLMGALGIGGQQGSDQALQNFMSSSGYNFVKDEALKGVSGSAAAKGLLQSGSLVKALTDRAGSIAQTGYQNWLGGLQNLLGGGMQAAGTLAGAGQTSKSKATSSPGIINSLFG